jgi:hypothetical protein
MAGFEHPGERLQRQAETQDLIGYDRNGCISLSCASIHLLLLAS